MAMTRPYTSPAALNIIILLKSQAPGKEDKTTRRLFPLVSIMRKRIVDVGEHVAYLRGIVTCIFFSLIC